MGKMAEQQRKLLEVSASLPDTSIPQIHSNPLSTANDGLRGDGYHANQCGLVGSPSMQELLVRNLSSRNLRKHRKCSLSVRVMSLMPLPVENGYGTLSEAPFRKNPKNLPGRQGSEPI